MLTEHARVDLCVYLRQVRVYVHCVFRIDNILPKAQRQYGTLYPELLYGHNLCCREGVWVDTSHVGSSTFVHVCIAGMAVDFCSLVYSSLVDNMRYVVCGMDLWLLFFVFLLVCGQHVVCGVSDGPWFCAYDVCVWCAALGSSVSLCSVGGMVLRIEEYRTWLTVNLELTVFLEHFATVFTRGHGPSYTVRFPEGYVKACIVYLCSKKRHDVPTERELLEPPLLGYEHVQDPDITFVQYLQWASPLNVYNWYQAILLKCRMAAHLYYQGHATPATAHRYFGNLLQDIVSDRDYAVWPDTISMSEGVRIMGQASVPVFRVCGWCRECRTCGWQSGAPCLYWHPQLVHSEVDDAHLWIYKRQMFAFRDMVSSLGPLKGFDVYRERGPPGAPGV